MKDLIEALQIFMKYLEVRLPNSISPTHCEHDVLCVMDINKAEISIQDIERLEKLSFYWGDPMGIGESCFYSNRFGSA